MNDLERLLRVFRTQIPSAGCYKFVLDNGISGIVSDLTSCLPVKANRHCFHNAQIEAALSKQYIYCEGYAMTDITPFPVLHGWLIDRSAYMDSGEAYVIDVTWEDGVYYWGVPFPNGYVEHMTDRGGLASLIDHWTGPDRFKLLKGDHAYKRVGNNVQVWVNDREYYDFNGAHRLKETCCLNT